MELTKTEEKRLKKVESVTPRAVEPADVGGSLRHVDCSLSAARSFGTRGTPHCMFWIDLGIHNRCITTISQSRQTAYHR